MALFRKIVTDDREKNQIQSNVDEAFKELLRKNPLFSGRTINGISIPTAAAGVEINHGLDRPYQGIIVIGQSVASSIFIAGTANPRPQDQIILRASVAVVASILVF